MAVLLLSFIFFVLTPLFFLPAFLDPFEWPKSLLLLSSSLALLIIWAVSLIRNRRLNLIINPVTPWLTLFSILTAVSALFAANRSQAFSPPTGAALFLSLTVTTLLLPSLIPQKLLVRSLKLTALAFSLATTTTVFLAIISPYLSLSPQPFFAPGNLFSLLTLSLISLTGLATWILSELKSSKSLGQISLPILTFILTLLGTLGLLWQTATDHSLWTSLPFPDGWQIAILSLKSQPLLGNGPTNFLDAFTQNRPSDLNSNPVLWNFRFFLSSDIPLETLTTLGLLGFASYAAALVSLTLLTLRHFFLLRPLARASLVALLTSALAQIIFPPTLISWWSLYAGLTFFSLSLLLSGSSLTREIKVTLPLPAALAAGSLVIAFSLASTYAAGRVFIAERDYGLAVHAIGKNEGAPAYNLLRSALTLNPYQDIYHATYSQINLALAGSISRSATSSGAPENSGTVTQLIKQAIREGKAAVALNPKRVSNWENLLLLYRSLIGSVDGSAAWAVAAGRQAVILDPTNPSQRLSLGGLYFSQGDFDNAALFFSQAAALKPDFANAHFNLGLALEKKKDLRAAISEMELALSLIPATSPDHQTVAEKLDALKASAQATLSGRLAPPGSPTTADSSSVLQPPAPLPSPITPTPLNLGSPSP